MNYTVGQIIYLLNDKTLKVIPAQVCEEVVRNTLSGKEITYLINLPDKKRTKANLNDIKSRKFIEASELQKFMIDNAKQMISKLLSDAYTLEKVFTENELLSTQEHSKNDIETKEKSLTSNEIEQKSFDVQLNETNDTMINVDIGNGMKARMRVEDLTKFNL